jgi:glycosyltransferase involved in cell wall biosynthesis
VRLVGRLSQSELRERLRLADLFLFPTHAEDPMPLAPLEAASVGCVPVIPLVSGVSEWLIDGVDCIKSERSASGFAAAIRRVSDGELDLEAIAKRGAKAVHTQFRIEKIMPTVETELVLLASKGGQSKGSPAEAYVMALIGHGIMRGHIAQGFGTALSRAALA